jgi:hypothetical protein
MCQCTTYNVRFAASGGVARGHFRRTLEARHTVRASVSLHLTASRYLVVGNQ